MSQMQEILASFDKVANQYDKVAFVQDEIGQRLFERLDYLKINPKRILDLGGGTGKYSQAMAKRYPKAQIITFDLSEKMLAQAKKKQPWLKKWGLVQGNMTQLPFESQSFDLIFSNQVIHWSSNLSDLFTELHRVMAVNACLMFSTLGPDTFKELSSAFQALDDYQHVNTFCDMHDIGDLLLQAQMVDPVVDMAYLTVRYKTVRDLLVSLKNQGVRNIHANRKTGLSGRNFLEKLSTEYERLFLVDGKVPLTYELVFGHAWRGEPKNQTIGQDTFIPIESIKRKKT